MTAMRQDQEIRAQAVHAVAVGVAGGHGVRNNKEFWAAILQVEDYITTGKSPIETKEEALARSKRQTRSMKGSSSV